MGAVDSKTPVFLSFLLRRYRTAILRRNREPRRTKGRSLGERPAFLRYPPWVWDYRSLGVCGKGASMNGLGSRWRVLGNLGGVARSPLGRCRISIIKAFQI